MIPSNISPDVETDHTLADFISHYRDGVETLDEGRLDLTDGFGEAVISVSGRIASTKPTETRVLDPWFTCLRCGTTTPSRSPGVFGSIKHPRKCQGCESEGPFTLAKSKTKFGDIQLVTIADHAGAPETEPVEVCAVLIDDLIDRVCVGDAVTIDAILTIERQNTSDKFTKVLFTIDISADGEAYHASTPPTEFDLSEFVTRSRNILYEHDALDETATREKIITPFITELGWDIFSPEVGVEYSGDAEVNDRADYVLSDSPEMPRVVVEAKGARRNLGPHTDQLRRYMRLFGCRYGLLTNGERYIFMGASEDSATPKEDAFLDCKLEKLPLKADIVAKLHRLNFGDGPVPDAQPVEVDEIDVGKKQRQDHIRAILKKNNEDQPAEARGTLRDTLEQILELKGVDTTHLDEDLSDLCDRGQIYSLEQGVLRVA